MTKNPDPLKYGDESAESLPNKQKYKSEENQKDSSENSPFIAQKRRSSIHHGYDDTIDTAADQDSDSDDSDFFD
eukprot:scaffold71225_cov38-Cyclotella_meneghiniana.AAC.9